MKGFNQEECEKIISYLQVFETKHIEDFSPELYKEILDYYYTFIERTEETQWVFERFSNYLKEDYPNNRIAEWNNTMSINLHEYPTLGKFKLHVDLNREPTYYLITGCALNSDYKGGDLRAYKPYVEDLSPEQGKFYTMFADRPHEVTLITEGKRYSLVFFLTRDDLGIPKPLI